MAGLKTWVDQKWVDIGSKKKDGSFSKCGRSKHKAYANAYASKFVRVKSKIHLELKEKTLEGAKLKVV